jgi:hypothetical protein
VLSSPSGATIGTGTASSTILNDDVVSTLTMIGGTRPYLRSAPNAWHDAWANPAVAITHRHNGADSSEAWAGLYFGTVNPGTYGGSDFSSGALGVSGRAGGTQLASQELDGTEALRFTFADIVSQLDFTFTNFGTGDRAHVDLFDTGGTLIGSTSFGGSTGHIQNVPGIATAILVAEQGSFSIDHLSFG